MANVEGSSSPTPVPGWYTDPEGQGLRWWDGTQWTQQVRPSDSAPAEAPSGRYPLRYVLLDRWPVLLGAAAAIAAAAVIAILVLGRSGGSGGGGAQEQAVGETVDRFLAAVARGDEEGCRRFVDTDAPAIQDYLRLAEDVPGSESTCGFVGAGGRVATLSVAEVTVNGDEATAAFDDNPTVMHLSDSGRRWVIDGIR
jgi:hypothetical protein